MVIINIFDIKRKKKKDYEASLIQFIPRDERKNSDIRIFRQLYMSVGVIFAFTFTLHTHLAGFEYAMKVVEINYFAKVA